MTDQSRAELLVVEWEQARDRGTPLTPEQVCADAPHLLPAVVELLHKLYPDLDDTRERAASDTDAKTTGQGQRTSLPMMIGEYRVIRRIGAGGMGEVYEAEDPHLGRRVAIKVMQPKLFADPVARERFFREARAQAAVQHDHVAVIHDVKQAVDGTPYLVLPLLRGETLADRLKRQGSRPLPTPDVLRVGRQITEGLAAAHTKGLVHRDVKPSNVWLDAAGGQVKVLDFGLARWLDPEGYIQQGTPAGTLPYMPPEQLLGGTLDQRADLYSLGAVLFEMCTGRRAIEIQSIPSMTDAVLYQVPPPAHTLNPTVPEQLSKLIADLLAKEATARTPDTAAGVAAVLRLLDEREGATVTTSPQLVTRERRRWPLLAAGAVMLAVLVGLAVWVATRPPNANSTTSITAATPTQELPAATASKVRVDVRVERDKKLLRLDKPGALPLRQGDGFTVEAVADPPAYLYLVWVDPGHDVTPVYPWDPEKGWGSRPATEEPKARLRLPERGNVFTAPAARPGVATIVALTRSTPLDVPDDEVRKWFGILPDLTLDPEDAGAAVWFVDYLQVDVPEYRRTFGMKAQTDPFADWQGRLARSVGDRAASHAAVSFARTGK